MSASGFTTFENRRGCESGDDGPDGEEAAAPAAGIESG
jgi:hypothetical protein